MAEATLAEFGLAEAEPAQLEARRAAISLEMLTQYKGFNDPDLPIKLLQELSAITGALRRRTAKPPKVAKEKKKPGRVTMTTADLAKLL